jgi:hypothetical protein
VISSFVSLIDCDQAAWLAARQTRSTVAGIAISRTPSASVSALM